MLADHMRLGIVRSGWDTIFLGLILRLGVLPILILLIAVWLPIDRDLRAVLIVQSAMPTAVFPVVLAKMNGGYMATALRIVLATSLASLITIPLWLGWAMKFVQ